MKVKVIRARWWHHDENYVGSQPPPLEEQLKKKLDDFLSSVGSIKIIDIEQSLARDSRGVEVALLTIFYEQKKRATKPHA
ncbi:MAG: hypothetical protein WC750_04425 [Patescibacteria group bacterium]|jgi:hypothetical protein